MTAKRTSLMRATILTVATLGATAFVASFAVPTVAHAKNGGGGGNGNGGGNGGSNKTEDKDNGRGGSKSAKSDDKSSKGKSSSKSVAVTETSTTTKSSSAKGNKLARTLGVHPSELGALNALNASPNAFANAAPNSRVGRIAAYRQAVLDGRVLEEDYVVSKAEFDTLTPPDRDLSTIDQNLSDKALEREDIVSEIEYLTEYLGSEGLTEEEIVAANEELGNLSSDLQSLDEDMAALQSEQDYAEDYAATEAELSALEAMLGGQKSTQRSLLEAAANKPVDDRIEAAVRSLLGL